MFARRGRPLVFGSAVTVVAVTTAPALAAAPELEPDEAVRISYVAPSMCPSEDVFIARIQARSRRMRLASASEPARTFSVRIAFDPAARAVGSRAVGSFRVTTADGETSGERLLKSATCDEVVTAVALAAALTVESLPPSERSDRRDVEASPNASSSTPTHTDRSPTRAGREAPLTPAPKREPWRFAVGAQGAVQGGISPELAFAVPAFGELEAPWSARSTLRLAFVRSLASSTALSREGATRFTWTAGVADACPRVFSAGSWVALFPCVRFEAGAVEGAAERITPARTETRTWMAVGAVLRVRVTVTKLWFVETEGALRAPLLHDRFYVEPGETVFRPPRVAWSGGVGMGARFP